MEEEEQWSLKTTSEIDNGVEPSAIYVLMESLDPISPKFMKAFEIKPPSLGTACCSKQHPMKKSSVSGRLVDMRVSAIDTVQEIQSKHLQAPSILFRNPVQYQCPLLKLQMQEPLEPKQYTTEPEEEADRAASLSAKDGGESSDFECHSTIHFRQQSLAKGKSENKASDTEVVLVELLSRIQASDRQAGQMWAVRPV